MTGELIPWLHAQLDEDQRLALAAWRGPWRATGPHKEGTWGVEGPSSLIRTGDFAVPSTLPVAVVFTGDDRTGGTDKPNAEHMARHDPARVLRKVEATRRLIAAYLQADEQSRQEGGQVFGYHATGMLKAIKQAATEYDDQPGYQERWRP